MACHDKHDRLSALAALTVSPKRQHVGLDLRFQPDNFQAIDVADFLRALLRHLRGPIILLWDRGSIPRSRSGTLSKAAPPIVSCGTRESSGVASRQTPGASGAPSRHCARSSAVPSCPRHRKGRLITYAKFNNICSASEARQGNTPEEGNGL
jgi:hypothetical protein